MFARVRWHLVGWNFLVLALILSLIGGSIYVSLSRSLMMTIDTTLIHRSEEARGRMGGRGGPPITDDGYRGGDFTLVLGRTGEVLFNPQQVDPATLHLPTTTESTPRFVTTTLSGSGPVRLYLRSLPMPAPSGVPFGTQGSAESGGALVIGESLTTTQQTLHHLLVVLLVSGIAAILLALGGAWFLAGRALVPIQQSFARQREFVADAAHELRTPLTVLRSATDLLSQHLDEPLATNAALLGDVRQEIAWMQRLTDELLTVARGDGGALDLATGEVDLPLLVTAMVARVTPLARRHALVLTFVCAEPSLPVEADPDRIEQILRIVFDNAIRHTPAGGAITVHLARQGREAVLAVRDTGEGIAPEHLPRIFDRFYRADSARGRAEGNTGLGLAIARTLVEAHGGTIRLTSTPGAGTTVTIRLPAPLIHAPAVTAEQTEERAVSPQGSKV